MNRFLLVCYSYFLDLFAINGSSLFCFYKEFEQVNAGTLLYVITEEYHTALK